MQSLLDEYIKTPLTPLQETEAPEAPPEETDRPLYLWLRSDFEMKEMSI